MRRRRRNKGQPGVAAVEFGLVLPIFLTLVLGIIDYGYYYFYYLRMANAAREGVRAGVVSCDPVGTATAVTTSYLPAGARVDSVTDPRTAPYNLRVNLSVSPFPWLINLLPPPGSQLTASASMRWEFADVPSADLAALCSGS